MSQHLAQQFVATKPGIYTVTATSHGVSQTLQIQVYGSTAAVQLKSGGNLVADGSSTQTVTVNALDSSGLVAQGENGTVVVFVRPALASLTDVTQTIYVIQVCDCSVKERSWDGRGPGSIHVRINGAPVCQ